MRYFMGGVAALSVFALGNAFAGEKSLSIEQLQAQLEEKKAASTVKYEGVSPEEAIKAAAKIISFMDKDYTV